MIRERVRKDVEVSLGSLAMKKLFERKEKLLSKLLLKQLMVMNTLWRVKR